MPYMSCGLEEFLCRYSNRKILCFGGGSYLKILLYDLQQREADIEIACIIDNDERKAGQKLLCRGREIPMLSLERAAALFDLTRTPLLITSASHSQILKQLESWPGFREMMVYSYYELKQIDTEEYTKLDYTKAREKIPKVIHYCWFGGGEMPVRLKSCIDTWKRHCPDYKIIEWNENNYDIEKNIFMRTASRKKKWGFIPDFARLDIIYENGGVYLDTDVELLKSPDDLLVNDAFFCTEITGGINEGSGFGAVKGNPLVGTLRTVYQELSMESPFLFNTCLGKEIGTFYDFGYKNNGKFQIINGMAAVYPYQVMSPYIKETGETKRTAATIGIHHFDGSWCKGEV